MKLIVSGMARLTPEYVFFLEEPLPFQLASNLRDKLIIGDTIENIRPFLKELRNLVPANDRLGKGILEALILAPKSRQQIPPVESDIDLRLDADLDSKLVGPDFDTQLELVACTSSSGKSREQLFNEAMTRFCKTASSTIVIDRYIAKNLSNSEYHNSGCNWSLRQILSSGIPFLNIYTSDEGAEHDLIKERILQMQESAGGGTKIQLNFARPYHDRLVTFNFSGNTPPFSMTIGKGLEIFRFETLRETSVVTQMPSQMGSQVEQEVRAGVLKTIVFERTEVGASANY